MKGTLRQALSAPPNEASCFSMPNPRPADGAPSLRPFLSCTPLPFQRCSAGLFCLQSRKPQGSWTAVCQKKPCCFFYVNAEDCEEEHQPKWAGESL